MWDEKLKVLPFKVKLSSSPSLSCYFFLKNFPVIISENLSNFYFGTLHKGKDGNKVNLPSVARISLEKLSSHDYQAHIAVKTTPSWSNHNSIHNLQATATYMLWQLMPCVRVFDLHSVFLQLTKCVSLATNSTIIQYFQQQHHHTIVNNFWSMQKTKPLHELTTQGEPFKLAYQRIKISNLFKFL